MPWQLSLGIAQVAKETVIIVAAFDSSDVFIECFRVYQLSIKEFISGNHETWLYLKKKKKKKWIEAWGGLQREVRVIVHFFVIRSEKSPDSHG